MERVLLKRTIRCAAMALALLVWLEPGFARELTLAVHPVLPAERTHDAYQPLVDYLSAAIAATEQVPAPALSAAKSVDRALQKQIREALLQASSSAAGRAALEALHIPAFEPVQAQTFRGHGQSLENLWGY